MIVRAEVTKYNFSTHFRRYWDAYPGHWNLEYAGKKFPFIWYKNNNIMYGFANKDQERTYHGQSYQEYLGYTIHWPFELEFELFPEDVMDLLK